MIVNQPIPSLPKIPSPKEKLFYIKISEDLGDELPILEEFIEEGYKKDFFQDYNISIRSDFPEKLLPKFNQVYIDKIFGALNKFLDDKFTDLTSLAKIIDKAEIKTLKLDLLTQENPFETEEMIQELDKVFSHPFISLDLAVGLKKAISFKNVNLCFQKFKSSLENLQLKLNYNSDEEISTFPFLGDSLEYLQNVKHFNLYLQDFPKGESYFLQFFDNLPQMKNLETLELTFDKVKINNETLMRLYSNIIHQKLGKLKKFSIKFLGLPQLHEMQGLSLLFERLHETNLKEFGFEISQVSKYPEKFLSQTLEKTEINEKIEVLEVVFKNHDFFPIENYDAVKNFIIKFPKIRSLELSLCENKIPNEHWKHVSEIFSLENVTNLEYLRLILAFNNFSDEFGRNAFEKISELTKLQYLFLDFQQGWTVSNYLTDAIHPSITTMLSKLVNLKSVYFNFDGNELKRIGQGYKAIEAKINEMKTQYNLIKHFKIMEREEVETPDKKANYKCHLPYEYFFNDFGSKKDTLIMRSYCENVNWNLRSITRFLILKRNTPSLK